MSQLQKLTFVATKKKKAKDKFEEITELFAIT